MSNKIIVSMLILMLISSVSGQFRVDPVSVEECARDFAKGPYSTVPHPTGAVGDLLSILRELETQLMAVVDEDYLDEAELKSQHNFVFKHETFPPGYIDDCTSFDTFSKIRGAAEAMYVTTEVTLRYRIENGNEHHRAKLNATVTAARSILCRIHERVDSHPQFPPTLLTKLEVLKDHKLRQLWLTLHQSFSMSRLAMRCLLREHKNTKGLCELKRVEALERGVELLVSRLSRDIVH